MAARGPWIDHFGENFLWSNATLILKGMAPYGVVSLEEMDRQSLIHPATSIADHLKNGPTIIAGGSGVRLKDRQGRELIEVFQPAYVLFANRRLGRLRIHANIMRARSTWRNTVRMNFRERKFRAEQN